MSFRWSSKSWEKLNNLRCYLFGHIWIPGWYGSEPYLEQVEGPTDGIGRKHIRLYCECTRCGEAFHIANTHFKDFNKSES